MASVFSGYADKDGEIMLAIFPCPQQEKSYFSGEWAEHNKQEKLITMGKYLVMLRRFLCTMLGLLCGPHHPIM